MELKRFKIQLDIKRKIYNEVFQVVQGDYDSNVIEIELLNDDEKYDLTGLNVEIAFKKPDGTTVIQTASTGVSVISAFDGKIECTLKTNTIAAIGTVVAEVRILGQDNKLLTSTTFEFLVRESIVNDDTIESTNEFPVLTELINTTNSLIDQVGQIEAQVPEQVVTDLNAVSTLANQLQIDLNAVSTLANQLQIDLATHKTDYASLFTTNADAKNSIYRGKYLGSSVTAAQYAAIAAGTFDDMYIGDYWAIAGVNYRIAAFNYYYNCGDTALTTNHVTLVPDTSLYTHVMNDTNITTGGYTGSKMYIEGLEQAKTTIRDIFGTHLVKHRQILSNATVDGKASGWAWLDSEVELMNEIMVYGASVFGASNIGGGSGYNIGVGKSQLPLFRLNPRMINTRQNYWLRDVVSAAIFALVYASGGASSTYASIAYGVRPAFSIS